MAMDKFADWLGRNLPPLRTEMASLDIQRFAGWIPMGPYLRFYYDLPGASKITKHAAEKWPDSSTSSRESSAIFWMGLK
jgi:6-phospho-beta-glucosidase